MITQNQIDAIEPGRSFPVQRRTIQTMNPAPANGWGCIQPTDLVAMLRRVAEEQGKPVRITERTTRAITKAGVVLMGCLAVLITIHVLAWWVKP